MFEPKNPRKMSKKEEKSDQTMSKKEDKAEPPPAWQVAEEDKDKALKYWKGRRSSSKTEVSKKVNQIKTLLATGPLNDGRKRTLERYMQTAREHKEKAKTATEEIIQLLDDEEMVQEAMDYLIEIEIQVEEILEKGDNAMSEPSAVPTGATQKKRASGWVEEEESEESEEDDNMSGISQARDRNYFLLMSLNYDITKEVPKFDGTKIEEFESWLSQWEAAELKMNSMEKTESEKLLALKRCLQGRALEYIKNVKEGKDANFEGAKKMLVDYYLDKHTTGKVMVDRLLDIPPMTRDADSIETGFFELRSVWESLQGLNLTGSQGQTLLFCAIAETKMTPAIRKAWAKRMEDKIDSMHPIGHTATEDDLFAVLNREIKLQRSISKTKKKEEKKEEKNQDRKEKRSTLHGSFATTKKEDKGCLICKETGHKVADCNKMKQIKTGQERRKFLKEKKIHLCWNCLKGQHRSPDCTREAQCKVAKCGQKHHTLLHQERKMVASTTSAPSQNDRENQKKEEKEEAASGTSVVAAALAEPSGTRPILQTCKAWIVSPGGEKVLATVFLDCGSELSLVRRDIARKIGLNGPKHHLQLQAVGGQKVPDSYERKVTFRLESVRGDYISSEIKAVTKETLTDRIRAVTVNPAEFSHLKDLEFTEEYPRKAVRVDVLIGTDYYEDLMDEDIIRGGPGEPTAKATKLGLILCGKA